jgi:ferric hydroxamate transport system ATP-binding protein
VIINILLDEPISALDIAHQIAVLDLVQKLAKARGLSIVMVLHDINMASCYCDEIIALRDGSLIARGSPSDIMTPDHLKRIYEVDFTIHPQLMAVGRQHCSAEYRVRAFVIRRRFQ